MIITLTLYMPLQRKLCKAYVIFILLQNFILCQLLKHLKNSQFHPLDEFRGTPNQQVQDLEFGLEFKINGLGLKVQGLGFFSRVQGLGFRVQCLEFRVQGLVLKFRIKGFGFGLRFRIKGLGFSQRFKVYPKIQGLVFRV